MAGNEGMVSRNPVIVILTVTTGEQNVDLVTSSLRGKPPVSTVVIKAIGAMQYGWKAGGPYIDLAAGEVREFGAIFPGDNTKLYYKAGSSTSAQLEIYN